MPVIIYYLYNFVKAMARLISKTIEEIMGKGENAGYQYFLIFQRCFLPFHNQIPIFEPHLFSHLQMLSILSSPKFCDNILSSDTG